METVTGIETPEGAGGGTPDAASLGGTTRGLCLGGLPRHQARQCRAARRRSSSTRRPSCSASIFGAKAVLQGDLTVGALVAFNMLANQVHGPVLRLAQMWQEFQQVRISAERLGDILNSADRAAASPGRRRRRRPSPARSPSITSSSAIARMRQEVLSTSSSTFRRADGRHRRLVGLEQIAPSPSWCGGSIVPERGRVAHRRHGSALIDPAWLRRQVGVVLQENVLFSGTVAGEHRAERSRHADGPGGGRRPSSPAPTDFILGLPAGL